MSGAARIVCVVGATGTGKTELAVRLAPILNGEVISGDSMQVYESLDIGTAKPRIAEMRGVRHHLISTVSPSESYSVARYVAEADAAATDIISRGKTVIVAGGTGLYVDAFVKGLQFSQKSDIMDEDRAGQTAIEPMSDVRPTVKRRLCGMYDRFGASRMHRLLCRCDAAAGARIHANDKKRLVRALEVYFSGGLISEHDKKTALLPPRYDALYLGLDFQSRDALYRRIDARVDAMLAAGLMQEARLVYQHRKSWTTAACAIGYKELFPLFDYEESNSRDPSRTHLDSPEYNALKRQCADDLKRATRRYAKRQLTWFRRNKSIHWFYPDLDDFSVICQNAAKHAQDFMQNA